MIQCEMSLCVSTFIENTKLGSVVTGRALNQTAALHSPPIKKLNVLILELLSLATTTFFSIFYKSHTL